MVSLGSFEALHCPDGKTAIIGIFTKKLGGSCVVFCSVISFSRFLLKVRFHANTFICLLKYIMNFNSFLKCLLSF